MFKILKTETFKDICNLFKSMDKQIDELSKQLDYANKDIEYYKNLYLKEKQGNNQARSMNIDRLVEETKKIKKTEEVEYLSKYEAMQRIING